MAEYGNCYVIADGSVRRVGLEEGGMSAPGPIERVAAKIDPAAWAAWPAAMTSRKVLALGKARDALVDGLRAIADTHSELTFRDIAILRQLAAEVERESQP